MKNSNSKIQKVQNEIQEVQNEIQTEIQNESKKVLKKEEKLIDSILSGNSSDSSEKSSESKEYRVKEIQNFSIGDFVEFQSAQNNKSYHGQFVNGIITHFVHDPKVKKDFIHIKTEDNIRLCKESSKVTLIK